MTDQAQDFPFGYCTNVHAGLTLSDAQANLQRIAVRVRQLISPQGRLPVGLWLPERAAQQLNSLDETSRFGDWLAERALKAYTFNGFPQGDFHQRVVKHAVYEPNWLDAARVDYTCRLADILARLLSDETRGSISTVPLGWPHRRWQKDDYARAASNLQRVARHLHATAERTGREIVLAIEPEPGCVINTAAEMVQFFNEFLMAKESELVRRHITVCHDICHSAVMFESQETALSSYALSGIRIGKLQVSSAVEVPWPDVVSDRQREERMIAQLLRFDEPRYLHQTTRIGEATGQLELVDDLPLALERWLPEQRAAIDRTTGAWRIHFHVPIYTDRFGELHATRGDISEATAALKQRCDVEVADRPWFTGDYEVETYAWGVLPAELQVGDLAEGIARELKYFEGVLTPATGG